MRPGAGFAIVTVLLAGCFSTAPSPSPTEPSLTTRASPNCVAYQPETQVPAQRFNGTGRFEFEMRPPGLTPGQEASFNVTFFNPDCRDYRVYYPCETTGDDAIRVGRLPWRVTEEEAPGPMTLTQVCLTAVRFAQIKPGQLYQRELRWNGSFLVWEHASLERGEGLATTWVYARPGPWPVEYGWGPEASYPTKSSTTFSVRENDLNRASVIHPDSCPLGGARAGAPTIVDATLEAWPTRQRLGQPVMVWFNYTVDVPSPRCFVIDGVPRLYAEDAAGQGMFSLGDPCGRDVSAVLLRSEAPTVRAYRRWSWNGTEPCGAQEEAAVGVATLHVSPDGFADPEDLPTARVEWTPR